MTKHERQIAALISAWKKQTDVIKRARIADKIRQLRENKITADWLAS